MDVNPIIDEIYIQVKVEGQPYRFDIIWERRWDHVKWAVFANVFEPVKQRVPPVGWAGGKAF